MFSNPVRRQSCNNGLFPVQLEEQVSVRQVHIREIDSDSFKVSNDPTELYQRFTGIIS